jgi:uncharacterized protein (TIGR03083 family)
VIPVAAATDLVRTEWGAFVDALAAADPRGWDRPTRLAGWTVEDLARHVHWGTTLESDGLALASSGGSGPAAGTELRGPREEIVPALHRAVGELVDRLSAVPDPPDGTVPMPYGPLPLAFALEVFVMEAAIHTADLVAAVEPGGRRPLPPGAYGACASVLQAFWPVLAAAAMETPPAGTAVRLAGRTVRVQATFDGAAWTPSDGEPTTVVEGEDEDLVLYAYGRAAFDPARLAVTGDRDVAVRLKTFVPGP